MRTDYKSRSAQDWKRAVMGLVWVNILIFQVFIAPPGMEWMSVAIILLAVYLLVNLLLFPEMYFNRPGKAWDIVFWILGIGSVAYLGFLIWWIVF